MRGNLSEIFALDCDIAGACNHSREVVAEQVWEKDREALEAIGWEIGKETYINGGVLFFGDTAGACRLADEWHRRWSESSRSGVYFRDQPALNSALHAIKPRLVVLPDRFNAQFMETPEAAINADIWHYYSSVRDPDLAAPTVLVQNVLHAAGAYEQAISRLKSVEQHLKSVELHLNKVLASKSWRITAPLRWAEKRLRGLVSRSGGEVGSNQ